LHGLVVRAPGFLAEKGGKTELTKVAAAAVEQLGQIGQSQSDDWWVPPSRKSGPGIEAELVGKLFDVLQALGASDLHAAALQSITARTDFFEPVSVLVPAIPLLPKLAAQALWEHCARFILQRSEHPPAAPHNWRQEEKVSCSCAECRELQAFVADPVAQVHRFRMREERRRHLEHTIKRDALDMRFETDRKGSPQTLVCTKTRAVYRHRCHHYRQDVLALQSLAQQGGPTEAMQRIGAAVERRAAWHPGGESTAEGPR
jgi:hypothetical protein